MKKFCSRLLFPALLLALAGCGGGATPDEAPSPVPQEEPARLGDQIPGLTEFLAPWQGIGTLLLDIRYKLNNYVWLRHVKSGNVTCMDHLQQYFMRALEAVDVEGRDGSGLGESRRVNPDDYV